MPTGRFKGVPNIGTEVYFEKKEDKISFLSGQLELLRNIKDGEKTWADMNEYRKSFGYPDTNIDSVRRSFAQLSNYDIEGWVSQPSDECDVACDRGTVDTNFETGQTQSSKVIKISDDDISKPELLLKAHGFDPDKWRVIRASNTRMSWSGRKGDSSMYSSRIVVAPLKAMGLSIEDIDNYFAECGNRLKGFKGFKINPKKYDADGDFLEVCMQDIHMGLLSYDKETGEDYDVAIARKRIESLVEDIIDRSKGKKYKRVVLALIGDIVHIDNTDGTTTKGTRQDVDTRPQRVFDQALDTLIGCIEALGDIAPITVVNIPGNHDRLMSYTLGKSLEMAFRGDGNVEFYNSPNPRKAIRFGKVLIGWAHGDDLKVDGATSWLSEEFSEDWGQSKYREAHLGHFHSVKTVATTEEQRHGIIVRYLPALCASSAWEHLQGFPKALRSLVCFEWNEERGLRSIWYNNIKD